MVLLTGELLKTRLRHIPGQNVVYLNNPKAACSTIKRTLWEAADTAAGTVTYHGDPHAHAPSPFFRKKSGFFSLDIESLLVPEWFSVVRNPFVRVLSAYLDKIPQERRDPWVWAPLKRRFRMPEETPPFADFLQMLLSESVPDALESHFCPQVANLLHGLAPLSYVGRLEVMEETAAWLEARGFHLKSHSPHATEADSLIQSYYGTAETDAVLKLYRADFDAFGYCQDPAQLAPIRAVTLPARNPEPIKLLLLCLRPGVLKHRRSAFDELARLGPGGEAMQHLLLEAGLATWEETMEAFEDLTAGHIRLWPTALKLGKTLAQREMAIEAAAALKIACELMYPQGHPPEADLASVARFLS